MAWSRRRTRGRARGGFSLIEVLVSILLMTIGFAGLSAMQLVASRSGQATRNLAEATQLCRTKAEELSVMRPLPPPPPGGELVDTRGCLLVGDVRLPCQTPMAGTRYTRTWTEDAAAGQFSVEVSWTDYMGKVHKMAVTSAL